MIKDELLGNLDFVLYTASETTVDDSLPWEGWIWRQLPYWVISFSHKQEKNPGFVETHASGSVEIHDNTVSIIPPNVLHKYSISPGHKSTSTWCHVSYPIGYGLDIANFLDSPFILTGDAALQIRDCIREIITVQQADTWNILQMSQLNQAGFRLLSSILPHCTESELKCVSSRNIRHILNALKYIQANLSTRITVPLLAEQAHLSIPQFHTVFKAIIKIKPMEFVRKIRMNKACDILLTTHTPVNEVAGMLGYEDPYTFSRAFKKVMGLSPLKFRKNPTVFY